MTVVNLDYINLLELGHTIQLTGMLLTDSQRDQTFLVPLPNEDITNEITTLSLSHDDWKTLLKQTDIQETEVLVNDEGKIKKAILRKSTRQIESGVSWNVFRRDNYTCRYCGRNDVPLTVDHLILWEDGGPSIEENLVSCCRKCNKIRGSIKYKDWLESRQYTGLSKGLSFEVRQSNLFQATILDRIPIKLHIPSRAGSKKKKRGRN